MPILGPWFGFGASPKKTSDLPADPEKYDPFKDVPTSRFAMKCHPKADEVTAELDDYFEKNWPWKDEKEKKAFRVGQYNLWACMALPLVHNDRILMSCQVNTLLFLLDDVAEDMTVEEGKELYRRLIPIASGDKLPNRDDPLEWITYDTWANMRAVDAAATDVVLQGALLCVIAQVDVARLNCRDMGALLRHRTKEAGVGFVAAVMRFGMRLTVTNEMLNSISAIDESYSRLSVTVNDIHSFDKELRAWNDSHSEGATLLNMVHMLANDTGLPYEPSKRVLWVLTREWELEHNGLVKQREMAKGGCPDDLKTYLKGLEYIMGGNEAWSEITERYYPKEV